MPKKQKVSYVRIDGARRLMMFVVALGILGCVFVGGVLVGQQIPRPIEPHFEAETEDGTPEVVVEAPVPDETFTFYDELARPAGVEAEGQVGEPVQGQGERALARSPGADDLGRVGEAAAADSAEQEPRALERVAAVDPQPVPDPSAASPNASPDSVAEPRALARAIAPEEVVSERAAPAEPVEEPEVPAAGESEPRPSVERQEPRRIIRRVVAPSDDREPFSFVVSTAPSLADAERMQAQLLAAGLRPRVEESGAGYAVLVEGQGAPTEVERQRRLAERVVAVSN